jgi:hypothetical protein
MPITATFRVEHEDMLKRYALYEDKSKELLGITIQVTGDNLIELNSQAEKFAQDYAVLNRYSPDKMRTELLITKR